MFLTHLAINKLGDILLRGQQGNITLPTKLYAALFAIKGQRQNGTPYVVNDYIINNAAGAGIGDGELYKCTVAGISSAVEPAANLWPATTPGGTIVDGAVTWKNCSDELMSAILPTEMSGTNYARLPIDLSLANFSGTQGQGTTVVSNGTSDTFYNNVAFNFAQSGAKWGITALTVLFDLAAGGNAWMFLVSTYTKTVDMNTIISIPVNQWGIQLQSPN